MARTASGVLVALTALLASCGPKVWHSSLHDLDRPPLTGTEVPFLKAHLHNGGVAVFSAWTDPRDGDGFLTGVGQRFDPDRQPETSAADGTLSVPVDSIALLETNSQEAVGQGGFAGLVIWTAVSTAVTVSCVSDPKSCFGSCPTFYTGEGDSETLVAEGFSSSFARVLEEVDVDAISAPVGAERGFSLLMRNEAPETHAVKSVRILAVPRPPGSEVLATSEGRFLTTRAVMSPSSCRAHDEDGVESCLAPVSASDGREWFSESNDTNLARRQVVELEFDAPVGYADGGELGLRIQARQTLLSTFLFYQSIAYLGESAGEWLAELERGDEDVRRRALGLAEELGDIEVQVERDGRWETVGTFSEAGPIASDAQVVRLPVTEGATPRIRLRLTQGNWRLDHLALVRLGPEVEAEALDPSFVETVHGAVAGELALSRLQDPDAYLVTQRGEAYRLHFELPDPATEFALFLETRGYYYEWMRGEWAGEDDPLMAALIFSDPARALERMAPLFKAREATMEETFWSSRFRRDTR